MIYLDLTENRIHTVQDDAFKGLSSLVQLNLQGNEITALPSNAFEGLEKLEWLHLTSNKLRIISGSTREALRKIVSLKHLHLAENYLKSFLSLEDFINIETLDIRRNNISSLCVRGMSNLKALYAGENNIVALNGTAFGELPNLSSIQLNRNNLKRFDEGTFDGLKKVRSLSMRDNLFTNVVLANLTKELPKLTSLWLLILSGNILENITLTNLSKLQYLYLDKGNISIFQLKGLDNLKKLDLKENRITKLNAEMFEDIHKLQHLDISRNFIYSIEEKTFDQIKDLHTLNLHGNELKSISQSVIGNLTSLQYLQLQNNQLSRIADETFRRLTSLKSLHLSDNRIRYLSSEVFKGLDQLHTLYLSYNQLTAEDLMNNKTFQFLGSLASLFLSGNRITKIDNSTFCPILKNLGSIHLEETGLSTISTGTFNCLHKLNFLRLGGNSLTKITNITFSGLNHLDLLDISNNNITYVQEWSIPFDRMRRFNADGNRIPCSCHFVIMASIYGAKCVNKSGNIVSSDTIDCYFKTVNLFGSIVSATTIPTTGIRPTHNDSVENSSSSIPSIENHQDPWFFSVLWLLGVIFFIVIVSLCIFKQFRSNGRSIETDSTRNSEYTHQDVKTTVGDDIKQDVKTRVGDDINQDDGL